jgi:hypothetical protein
MTLGASIASAAPADPPQRIDVRSLDASSVTRTTALLSGTIKRGHGEACYQFEYVDGMGYDPGSACPYRNGGCTRTANLGEGRGDQTVARQLTGLLPGTTYHWRLVARSEEWCVAGPDRTFTTAPDPDAGRPAHA